MIRMHCTNCGHRLKVPDSAAGKRGKCPRCGTVIRLPARPIVTPPAAPRQPNRESFASLLPPGKPLDHEEWIDMTSMVDIVFFLLIFFMVTSLNAQQASISMPVPEHQSSAAISASGKRTVEDFESDDDFIIVRIDADDSVWVEDSEAPTPTDIVAKLRDKADSGASGHEPSRVLVLASGDAHHATAVMVLDAAHEAGLADVRLAVQDEV